MPIPRFYCPTLPLGITSLALPPAAAHHASCVLRLRVNDAVQLFDGAGHELHGRICEINTKQVLLDKLKVGKTNRESPLHIVLAQALCSSEKMDWIIQKATELGTTEIQPVHTRRSVAKLAGDRAEKRTEHWRAVAIAACEQCGRNHLPIIQAPQEFTAWMAQARNSIGSKLMLFPEATATLHEQAKPPGRLTILIGPEGGFEKEEMQLALLSGFVAIRMGKRVLRTETAAVAGLAALQTLWGDFSETASKTIDP